MKLRTGILWVAIAAAIAVLLIVLLHSPPGPTPIPLAANPMAERPIEPPSAPPNISASAPASAPAALPAAEADDEGAAGLPRDKVEAYLRRNHRNAASLIAAFHALNDTNYLREAATNFPNDPQLQVAVLVRDVFPAERRQWLDAFKASSPENSLANYLSATEHFKAGETDAAIKDLTEASTKTQFRDYMIQAMIDQEELNRSAGLTGLTALSTGWAVDLMGELSPMKGLGNAMMDARKQYLSSGDAASAEQLVRMGVVLSDRFQSGDGGKFLISQMVGNALEKTMLGQLDPNTPYDFLGGKTPAQRSEELLQRKNELRELTKAVNALYSNLDEAQLTAYTDRVKAYGEAEALRWLQQRQNAGSGN